MDILIPLKLLLALIIGAAIGLEREAHTPSLKSSDQAPHSIGVRTFSLVCALGTIAGFLFQHYLSIFLLISIPFMVLTIAFYILNSMYTKDYGITTEISIFFAYLLGILMATDIFPLQLIFAISVVLILILSRKHAIRNIISGIQREEINAFVSFALVALVILPFLPNQAYSISQIPQLEHFLSSYGITIGQFAYIELINPFKLWLIVVLITGIDMAGYLLERLIGPKKGRLLASLVGGFISSTATTQSLAQESKKSKMINGLVGSAILSNTISFFPIFILIASVNSIFLVQVTPFLLILITSSFLIGMFFLLFKKEQYHVTTTDLTKNESEIFAILPAIKFAVLFLIIRIITQISLVVFGNTGFLISSGLAGFTGIDAATINIAELAGKNIEFALGISAFLLVNSVNLLAKCFYSFVQGKREFAVKFSLSMIIIIAISFCGFLLQ